ncbi:glycosyltransferase family 39 protein [Catellatospora sp. NEAU-YM18]|nr:glycosyltransferase family 39 protein [Catellatospora tritici]
MIEGYPGPETVFHNGMAFFPLFPALGRAADWLLPFPTSTCAILVSWAGALAAAWGIYAVGAHVRDRRTGVLLAALWGLLPHAIIESMAYTEAIFTAFVAWALYAVLRERWIMAGALTLLAGLTRPTALAVIPVVGLAALITVVKGRDRSWRPWAAMVLAPLGWLGYILWVAQRTGRLDGYFYIQGEGWGSRYDGGVNMVRKVSEFLKYEARNLDYYLVLFVLVAALVLLAISVIDRQPWQLVVYSALMLVITLGGENYYNAKARFLLPAFALLLPVATSLARTKTATMVIIMATLAAASAYCGVYLVLIWQWSP